MKSLLFKTAWKLTKELGITFSEALKTAWASFKNEVEVIINTTWKGEKRMVFKKGNCQSGSISEVLTMSLNQKQPTMSGAGLYYGTGAYNAD